MSFRIWASTSATPAWVDVSRETMPDVDIVEQAYSNMGMVRVFGATAADVNAMVALLASQQIGVTRARVISAQESANVPSDG